GVYVDGAKIASLGLRIRLGCAFHCLALNMDMDMEPFRRINPCGYAGLAMTQLRDLLGGPVDLSDVTARLRDQLVSHLGYAGLKARGGGIVSSRALRKTPASRPRGKRVSSHAAQRRWREPRTR